MLGKWWSVVKFRVFGSALMALSIASGTAGAATISVGNYTASAYQTALASLGPVVTEGFEGADLGEVAGGSALSTAVGSFATLGGAGTGQSVVGSGKNLAVRDGTVFGRSNSTKGGARFLDSNDTWGISWTATTGSLFDRLVFVLTDVADQGVTWTMQVGETVTSLSGLGNGSRKIVSVLFDDSVSSAQLTFANMRRGVYATNDGFGIDDVAVNVAPAPVPLPAGVLLLTGALGILGLWRRRTA
jgi:hypothetical protein